MRIGSVNLAGDPVELFEILDPRSEFAIAVMNDGVPNWL